MNNNDDDSVDQCTGSGSTYSQRLRTGLMVVGRSGRHWTDSSLCTWQDPVDCTCSMGLVRW